MRTSERISLRLSNCKQALGPRYPWESTEIQQELTSCAQSTILSPGVTWLDGISYVCLIHRNLVSASTLIMKKTVVGIYWIALDMNSVGIAGDKP